MTTRAAPGLDEKPTEYRFDARSAGLANATVDLNRKELTEALISTDRRLRETVERLLAAERVVIIATAVTDGTYNGQHPMFWERFDALRREVRDYADHVRATPGLDGRVGDGE